MAEEFKGLTQAEVSLMIAESIKQHEEALRALGCNSEVGSMALKKHEQYHADKLNSKIVGFDEFKKQQTKDNYETALKMSVVLEHFNQTHAIIGSDLRELHEEIKAEREKREAEDKAEAAKREECDKAEAKDREKQDDKIWARLWAFVAVVVALALGSIWSVNASVSKVNKVDVDNQKSTETYLAILVQKLDPENRSIDEIVDEFKKAKEALGQ